MTITLLSGARQQTQHIIMRGITWETYQRLLKDLGDHRSSRLAYDQEVLEIIMPSSLHETLNRLLALIITTLVDELDLRIKNYGSTTLDREDLEKGAEPDSCFYIQNVDRILGKKLNLETDPPPDLAVEIDLASSSRRRFGIYLQLQIPEVWRYTQRQGITIYQLVDGDYQECEFSPTFSMVSGAALMQFIQLAEEEDDISVIRALRQWIKDKI
ncbi:MAG: Uma2 family endonuclease [Timaviella obliquedivisa GSE-PSE-MK23-08B]|jgi:Uma2 family endonuclease|nr:Uma2 family endonuclease [Timaviella obliquedivisa GSE-PSE-MK23-08B]